MEVGSVLEYSYELTYNPRLFATPTWEVQRRYFVHNAHYDFTPFKGFLPGARDQLNAFLIDSSGRTLDHLVWWWWLPNGMTVTQENVLGRFSLDINDVPPIPTEAWMPPDSSVAYSVEFYYTYATSAENFWIQAAKDWSKETDRFAEPSSAIRDAVGGLIASSDSDIEKAKKLYNAVQALDNTDYSRARSESERKDLKLKPVKTAQGVWAQKGGTSEELALLYLSMLRSAGLTAYSFKVVDRSRGVFDPSYMSINQLNATVVILSTGGKEILLDPGVKMCPFQTIDWRHSGAEGLRQTANGPSRAVTPYQNFGANIVKRTGTIQLDEHGGATGTIEIEMTGQQALIWRRLAIEVDESELKKRFDKEIGEVVPADVEAHVDHFVALDQPDATLTAVVKVNGTLGTPAGKRLILPAFLFEGRGGEPFVDQEMRQEPVDMHFGGQVRDQLTYSLPSDMTVEGAPQDTSESWENHATYIVRTKSGTGEITVARLIANAFTMAQPQEYKNLRGFYAKVASSDQGQLVLAIGTGTKGN